MDLPRLNLTTPPPITRSILPIHACARATLRSTSNDTTPIAGRETERAKIRDFLDTFLHSPPDSNSNPETTLYISGLPGTGKTALVNSILHDIDAESSPIKVIFINCMALSGIEALWDRLLEQLQTGAKRKVGGRTKQTRARDALDSILSTMTTKWQVFVFASR
jgi:cell division control protein 6